MNNNKRTVASVAAHVISDVFSPMLVPSYAMIAALTLTPMCLLPLSPKIWSTAGVVFITAIIPIVFILILMRMGKVSDTAISNRNERMAPFCATILCYIGAAFFVRYLRAPYWIQNFYLAAAMVSAVSLLVTHWWKISAHTGAIGGLSGVIFWMTQRGLLISAPLVWVCAAFLLLGLVAWARMYLNKHTVLQTLAGAALGFTVELIFLNITSQVL